MSSKQVKISQIKPAEFVRNVFAVVVSPEVRAEDLADPAAWMHVAGKLRPRDRVEVTSEDGAWFAEFMILSAGPTWARVAELRYVDFAAEVSNPEPLPDEFIVKWGNPNTKFRVIRGKDKVVVKDGFPDADAARAWIDQFYGDPAAE